MSGERPKMYHEFAEWFHLLTAPAEYAEEAEFYFRHIVEALGRKPGSWLELGSGGGNNASHYAPWVKGEVVLSDRSEEMLALSQKLNPRLEHVLADMLTIRLGRSFDVVFVHDAAAYLTTEAEVWQLAKSAFLHCKPGGVTMICPDHTAENVVYETDHGGHDGDGRAMRYLEWTTPGAPGSYEYIVDYAYVFHEDGKPPAFAHDRHINGALPRQMWLDTLTAAGFTKARWTPLIHTDVNSDHYEVFIASRPE